MLNSKDQVASYMIAGHVHLSKKDYGFFSNINKISKGNNPITSNQDKLFNKLLVKYKRQLSKLNIDIETIQNLSWKVGFIESKQEFLEAKLSIKDNNIILKAPFNTKFIQNFRGVSLNIFEWDKVKKYYIAPYSTYNLKIATENINKFYKDVNYCEQVNKILTIIKEFKSVKYWQPTLVKSNNNFYIYGLNTHVYEFIKNLELTNSPKTLFILSQYGIKIDDTVTGENQLLEFAGNFDVKVDLEQFDFLCTVLHELKVDHVFTTREIIYNKNISNEIKLKLLNYGISCGSLNTSINPDCAVLLRTSSSSHISYHKNNLYKIITLTNSRPIQIK